MGRVNSLDYNTSGKVDSSVGDEQVGKTWHYAPGLTPLNKSAKNQKTYELPLFFL